MPLQDCKHGRKYISERLGRIHGKIRLVGCTISTMASLLAYALGKYPSSIMPVATARPLSPTAYP